MTDSTHPCMPPARGAALALIERIDPEFASQPERTTPAGEARIARTPARLFADYCATRDVSDPKVAALFGELHDEVTASVSGDGPA